MRLAVVKAWRASAAGLYWPSLGTGGRTHPHAILSCPGLEGAYATPRLCSHCPLTCVLWAAAIARLRSQDSWRALETRLLQLQHPWDASTVDPGSHSAVNVHMWT